MDGECSKSHRFPWRWQTPTSTVSISSMTSVGDEGRSPGGRVLPWRIFLWKDPPFFMGKSTNFLWSFSIANCWHNQRVESWPDTSDICWYLLIFSCVTWVFFEIYWMIKLWEGRWIWSQRHLGITWYKLPFGGCAKVDQNQSPLEVSECSTGSQGSFSGCNPA